MDFEKLQPVSLDEYFRMIELKTSVLLAASLKMGAILGGAVKRNQNLLYEFGKKLGLPSRCRMITWMRLAIRINLASRWAEILSPIKKHFYLYMPWKLRPFAKKRIKELMENDSPDKVKKIAQIYKECKADEWALQLKNKFLDEAFQHLEDIAVLSKRKEPLKNLQVFW